MCIIQTFTHGSATVKVKPAGKNGVIEVGYFGIFTESAIDALIGNVAEEGALGRVMLLRMDRAIMAFSQLSPEASAKLTKCRTPGAVVCRPDQHKTMSAICRGLSAAGVLRLVYQDYSDALGWADALAAGLYRQSLQRMHRDTPALTQTNRLLVGCQIREPANEHAVKTRLNR